MRLYPDVVDAFANESGRLRTAASRHSYREVARMVQSTCPDRLAWNWTRDDVLGFLGQPGLAANTVTTRASILTGIFGWATFHGLIPHDPTVGIKYAIRPGHGNVRTGNWLTDSQVAELLELHPVDTARERRDRMIIVIGLFSGLRATELAGARWDALSRDMAMIRVHGKGRKVIDLPLPEQLTDELGRWRTEATGEVILPTFRSVTRARIQAAGPADRETTMLDRSVSYSVIRCAVAAAGALIGVPSLAAHDLRRSYAGWLDSTGMDIRAIRDLMRHSSVGVTERYLAANPHRTAKALVGLRRDLGTPPRLHAA